MNIKNWFTEKTVIYILCAVLGIATIIDLYTAYSSPLFFIAETNPLFLQYGVWALTLVNFIWMIVIIIGLKKSLKIFTIFSFVMAVLLLSYGHIIGAQANIKVTNLYYENPEKIINIAKNLTVEQKTTMYNDMFYNTILIPYFLCILGFAIIIFLYEQRKPIRDKYIDEGIKLINKGRGV